jgi:hypothetical protein
MSDNRKPSFDFPNDLMPQSEAAADLGVKPSTLAAWRSTGKGPDYWKWGREVYYSQSTNASWKAKHRHQPRKVVDPSQSP